MAIDLQKFCGFNGTWKPCNCKLWMYATDGHVAIRVPSTDPDSQYWFGQVVILFNSAPWPFGQCDQPWPEPSPVRGRASCPVCGGWADTLVTCEHCDAQGMAEQDLYQVVGEHRICIASDRLIRQLPNVLWAKDQPRLRKAIAFVFDGGQGLVAPLL